MYLALKRLLFSTCSALIIIPPDQLRINRASVRKCHNYYSTRKHPCFCVGLRICPKTHLKRCSGAPCRAMSSAHSVPTLRGTSSSSARVLPFSVQYSENASLQDTPAIGTLSSLAYYRPILPLALKVIPAWSPALNHEVFIVRQLCLC